MILNYDKWMQLMIMKMVVIIVDNLNKQFQSLHLISDEVGLTEFLPFTYGT